MDNLNAIHFYKIYLIIILIKESRNWHYVTYNFINSDKNVFMIKYYTRVRVYT